MLEKATMGLEIAKGMLVRPPALLAILYCHLLGYSHADHMFAEMTRMQANAHAKCHLRFANFPSLGEAHAQFTPLSCEQIKSLYLLCEHSQI